MYFTHTYIYTLSRALSCVFRYPFSAKVCSMTYAFRALVRKYLRPFIWKADGSARGAEASTRRRQATAGDVYPQSWF